jgi:hypothetical protein
VRERLSELFPLNIANAPNLLLIFLKRLYILPYDGIDIFFIRCELIFYLFKGRFERLFGFGKSIDPILFITVFQKRWWKQNLDTTYVLLRSDKRRIFTTTF